MPLNNFGFAALAVARCGQPDEDGIKTLAQINVRAIFKLNTECPAEHEWCDRAGIRLINYPMPTLTNTVADAKRAAEFLESTITEYGLTAVHCEHGRDRTGLVVGAHALIYEKQTFAEVQAARAMYGVTGIFTLFDAEITAVLSEIAAGLVQSGAPCPPPNSESAGPAKSN